MNAAEYYSSATVGLPYEYQFSGKDGAGRRKYARALDGEFLGYVSLLNFSEWKRECERVRNASRTLQLPARWTRTTDPDGTLFELLS